MQQITHRPIAGEDGFTLLELLVAMTLLGLLTFVMFAGLRFGTQAWAKTEAVTADANQIRSLQAFLTDELARAYPAFVMKIPTDAHVDFQGTASAMDFLAPDPTRTGAMLRIVIQKQDEGGHVAMVVTATPELANTPHPRPIGPRLRGFKAVAFSYYGADNQKDGPYWHDEWRNRSTLPQLIQISATLVKGVSVTWPDLIVAPRIAADEGCIFDALTRFCQGR